MKRRKLSVAEEKEVIKLYTIGKFSTRAIGKTYGYASHGPITRILKRHGIEQRTPAEQNRKYQLNPHIFDKIDTEKKAYFLGFIYADGCVFRRTLRVGLKSSDKIQLEKLKAFLKSDSPIVEDTTTLASNGKTYKRVHISFTDKHLANRLRDLGILPKRPNLDKCILQIPDHLMSHWIRGLFDGDGSFHSYKPGMSFVGQLELMEFIRGIFAVNIGPNHAIKIHKHNKANAYYLIYMGRPQCQKIAEWLYEDANIWLNRKRDIVNNYPEPQIRTRNKLGQWE